MASLQESKILWEKCSQILRDNLTPTVYNTWFAPIEIVEFTDGVLVLRVKSQFVVEYIEENYIDLLGKVIVRVFGKGTQLEYRVLMDSTTGKVTTMPSENAGKGTRIVLNHAEENEWNTQLNELYTFSNFVQGETNKLARTAGVEIAKKPGRTIFNPLFIFGGSGVGKTHLATAIGNQVARTIANCKVLYVSANTFKLQYQNACATNKIPDFLLFYQNIDVLIVDDIQYFSGLKGTQDTFFHIFNYLHQSQKQLILTSDRSPLQLQDVEERLLTRFKWGLSVEIQRPDFNLRKAILLDKMRRDGIELTEDVVDYIATYASQNIRDLEGILASLMAYSTLMNCEVDMAMVQSVVSRLVNLVPKEIALADVLGVVSEYTQVPEKILLSKSRQKDVTRARQMAMYIAKELTDCSLQEIGNQLGHRSHSTVLHAIENVKNQMSYDRVFTHDIQLLLSELKK